MSSYKEYIAGKSMRDSYVARRGSAKVVYVKEGVKLSLECRRDQVEALTQRMDKAEVKIISVDGYKHPRPYAESISQVAYYDNSYTAPLWVCDL